MIQQLVISVSGQGLHDITGDITALINGCVPSIDAGLCSLFIQHTSASLLIQENYDPSAKADLEAWMNRLVPENDPIFTHTLEGPDDMPAHIKSALTAVNLSIPILNGALALGTWQGIYLWEHRHYSGQRNLVVHTI